MLLPIFIPKGDAAIDATCGNVYDTLAMVKIVADESTRVCVYAREYFFAIRKAQSKRVSLISQFHFFFFTLSSKESRKMNPFSVLTYMDLQL